jgi:hypothetical protein
MEESKVCTSYLALYEEIDVKDMQPLCLTPKEGTVE